MGGGWVEVEDAFRVGGGLNGQMGKIEGWRKEVVRVNPIAHAKVLLASAVRNQRLPRRNILIDVQKGA